MGLREAPAQTACLVPLAFALGLTLLGRKEHLAELRWAGGQCWAPNTGSQGWLEEQEVNPSPPPSFACSQSFRSRSPIMGSLGCAIAVQVMRPLEATEEGAPHPIPSFGSCTSRLTP